MNRLIFPLFATTLISMGIPTPGFSQNDIPIGTWRSHYSYFSAQQVEQAAEKIYCASRFGLFFFDRNENSTTILSKINGLSDTQLDQLAYNAQTGQLLLGYHNGNLDIINENEVSNFNTIKLSETANLKHYNHISFNENFAYMSMGLGLVIFNLEEMEIQETYAQIGPNATTIEPFGSDVFDDTLYVATDLGLMAAPLSENVNRLDYRNWILFNEFQGLPEKKATMVKNWQGRLYAAFEGDSLYQYLQKTWQPVMTLAESDLESSDITNDLLVITLDNQILSISTNHQINQVENSNFLDLHDATIDEAGNWWVADGIAGLLGNYEGEFNSIRPNGPFADVPIRLEYYDGKIVAVSGGYANDLPLNKSEGFFVHENGQWQNFNPSNLSGTTAIPVAKDLVDIAYDSERNLTYFASFGYGILVWDNEENFEILNENTPGSTLINSSSTGQLTRVSSLATDLNGNLWLCNYSTSLPLQVLNNDGTWQRFSQPNTASAFSKDLFIPSANDIWQLVLFNKGGTILLYNQESGNSSAISRNASEGQIPSNGVNDVAEDLEGQIWLATNGGIVYFQTSFDLLESNPKEFALRPFFEGFPLLANEVINCIKVDGGNRKWVGTNKGLWLFGPAGESQVFHFTVDNSPLPSNKILDVEINEISGEVFIATDSGLLSFRGTATKGGFSHQEVKVFPNPVTPDFTGTIGISGLANNAWIKITDISGKLIYETRANGSTAIWDGRDYSGRRAQTGMYLILSSSDNGEETFVGKIAVIE